MLIHSFSTFCSDFKKLTIYEMLCPFSSIRAQSAMTEAQIRVSSGPLRLVKCLSICLSVCLSVCLSDRHNLFCENLSARLKLRFVRSGCLLIRLSVCSSNLSVCQSVYLSIHLILCSSVCLFLFI